MEEYAFANIAYSNLAEPIDESQTTIQLQNGGGATFAQGWSPGKVMALTLVSPSREYEIVKVTNIQGDIITVERQQEGTTARDWPVGTMIVARVTAGVLSNFIQKAFRTFPGDPNGIYECEYVGEKAYDSSNTCWWIAMGGKVWKCYTYPCAPQTNLYSVSPLESLFPLHCPYMSADSQGDTIIAVAGDGILKSYDAGDTWEIDNNGELFGEDGELLLVCSGPTNTWVISGYTYHRYSVDNGSLWNEFLWYGGYSFYPKSLKYIDGQFVAVGENMTVQVSLDGSTWTEKHRDTGVNYTFRDVAYDGDKYVAVGDVNVETTGAWESYDLEQWTRIWEFPEDSWFEPMGIVYFDGKWIANNGRRVWYSTDLTNWTELSFDPYLYPVKEVNDKLIIGVGRDGSATPDFTVCYTSEDGENWTARQIDTPYHSAIKSFHMLSSTYASGKYWLFGCSVSQDNGSLGSSICKSDDIVTWTNPTPPKMKYKQSLRAMLYHNNTIYVAGQQPEYYEAGYQVWSTPWEFDIHKYIASYELFHASEDHLNSWQVTGAILPGIDGLASVTAMARAWGRYYFAITVQPDVDTGMVFRSNDLINWVDTGASSGYISMMSYYGAQFDSLFCVGYDPVNDTGCTEILMLGEGDGINYSNGPNGDIISGFMLWDEIGSAIWICVEVSTGIYSAENDDPWTQGFDWTQQVSSSDNYAMNGRAYYHDAYVVTNKNSIRRADDYDYWPLESVEEPRPTSFYGLSYIQSGYAVAVGTGGDVHYKMGGQFRKMIPANEYTDTFFCGVAVGTYPQGSVVVGGEGGELQVLPMDQG